MRRVVSLLVPALIVASCYDAKEDLNDFNERARETGVFRDASLDTNFEFDAGDAGDCTRTDGTTRELLFTFSTSLDPDKPLMLLGTVIITGGGTTIDVDFQQLSAADRMSPVGERVLVTGVPVEPDGSFDSGTQLVPIDAEANSILVGTPVESEVRLQGARICDDTEFACGVMSGKVLGLELEFTGTFTAQFVSDPANVPGE